MKSEQFREMTGRFPLNEIGDPIFLIKKKFQMAHGQVQCIAISRKVKNSALKYFYSNDEKNTSLGTSRYVTRGKFFDLFFISLIHLFKLK